MGDFKFSFDEIADMQNAICDNLDFMVQNDKQHTKRYKSLIQLRDKLSIIIMDMYEEKEDE
tara:strand:+ start:783 stop:965 length:183 start_codon:yes stop_codon:yes gene_type:complete